MPIYAQKDFEIDFRKWFSFSRCAGNDKMLYQLKMALECNESQGDITYKPESGGLNEIVYISETYNPTILKLNRKSHAEFLTFVSSKCPERGVLLEEQTIKTGIKNQDEGGKSFTVKQNNKVPLSAANKEHSNELLLSILQKISSPGILKHSFIYSLVAVCGLQVVILPGNISSNKPGGWGIYVFLGLLSLVWLAAIWSYSKLFYNIKAYNDIFKITAAYIGFFFFIVFLEISVIDFVSGHFSNILFYLFLMVFIQVIGLIISLFLTMIMYFLKGGKMINIK